MAYRISRPEAGVRCLVANNHTALKLRLAKRALRGPIWSELRMWADSACVSGGSRTCAKGGAIRGSKDELLVATGALRA